MEDHPKHNTRKPKHTLISPPTFCQAKGVERYVLEILAIEDIKEPIPPEYKDLEGAFRKKPLRNYHPTDLRTSISLNAYVRQAYH